MPESQLHSDVDAAAGAVEGEAAEMIDETSGFADDPGDEQLAADERAKDPLLEFAAGANRRLSRVPAHASELFDWMSPLFAGETREATLLGSGNGHLILYLDKRCRAAFWYEAIIPADKMNRKLASSQVLAQHLR